MTKPKQRPVDCDGDEGVSEAEIRTFSSWKFDLLETINADPKTNPTDLAIIEAYLHFTRARSRTAFLSALSLRVRTGIVSSETIVASRKKLIALGYMIPEGRSRTGAQVFRFVNARRNDVLDHIAIATETLREADAQRKQRDREKQRLAPRVLTEIERTRVSRVSPDIEHRRDPCLTRNRKDVSPKIEDKHLEGTPVYPEGTERGARSPALSVNPYAAMKGRI